MRSYTTRPKRTGRYLVLLVILTVLYLGLMLPAVAAITVALMALAPAGEGLSAQEMIPPALALLASGTYPVVALVAMVAGWARYGQGRFPQAIVVALLPMANLALFGLAVFLASRWMG